MSDKPLTPNYGKFTLCRPMLKNVPGGKPGWTLVSCPYCGCDCWKQVIEPDPLPANCAAACTECALKRNYHQREMDAARYAKESAL